MLLREDEEESKIMTDRRLYSFLRIVTLSRVFNLLLIFLLFPGGIVLGIALNVEWIGLMSMFLVCVSGILPGLFILFNAPWIAQAWLRGMNPHFIPETPWEKLSKGKKFSIYFYSVIGFIAAIAGIFLIVSAIS